MSLEYAATNVESDQAILQKTVIAEGKWRFFDEGGTLIAEAAAPSEVTMSVRAQWAEAVRTRVRKQQQFSLSPEQEARRALRKEAQWRAEAAQIDAAKRGEIAIPEGAKTADPVVIPELPDELLEQATIIEGEKSVDIDPDELALNTYHNLRLHVEGLEEDLRSLVQDLEDKRKKLERWARLAGVEEVLGEVQEELFDVQE